MKALLIVGLCIVSNLGWAHPGDPMDHPLTITKTALNQPHMQFLRLAEGDFIAEYYGNVSLEVGTYETQFFREEEAARATILNLLWDKKRAKNLEPTEKLEKTDLYFHLNEIYSGLDRELKDSLLYRKLWAVVSGESKPKETVVMMEYKQSDHMSNSEAGVIFYEYGTGYLTRITLIQSN